jgi:hypothetical protein
MLLDGFVTERCAKEQIARKDLRFTRRQVREATGWGNTQLKIHMSRLEELEYLAVHRAGRGQGFVNELVYDGQGKDGTPFLAGLVEAAKIHEYERKWAGVNGSKSAPGRPEVGPLSGGGRGGQNGDSPKDVEGFNGAELNGAENALLRSESELESYVDAARAL